MTPPGPVLQSTNVAVTVMPVDEKELLAEEEQAQREAKQLKQVLNNVQCKYDHWQ